MSSLADWVWMPHPGHFICGFDCRFHLTTKVGEVIVSTVGEYFPDEPVREILAKSRGIELVGSGDERLRDYHRKIGFEDIGHQRKYETMVFRAEPAPEDASCCPWRQTDGQELDFDGYNEPGPAYRGHLSMCDKWSAKEVPAP